MNLKRMKMLFFLGMLLVALKISVSYSQIIDVPLASLDWMYSVRSPGLRQEGQPVVKMGLLFYQQKVLFRGLEVEGMQLTTDIGTFRYGPSLDNLGVGWWPVERAGFPVPWTTLDISESSEDLLNQDLQSGFSCVDLVEKKKGTPVSWILVDARASTIVFPAKENCPLSWVNPNLLVFWMDPNYCLSDEDCQCVSGSGVRFMGCANRVWAPKSFGGAYECGQCRCVNQSCAVQKDFSEKKPIDGAR